MIFTILHIVCVGGSATALLLLGRIGREIFDSPKGMAGLFLISSILLLGTQTAVMDKTMGERLSFDVFLGCLVAAWIMDWAQKRIYRYVWFVAAVMCLVLGGIRGMGQSVDCCVAGIPACVVYCLFQELFFHKAYGRADCHAFCVCSVMLILFGGTFEDCVIHMMITYVLLVFIQMAKKNVIWKKGRLVEPVPMVPYIASAFCLWVDFMP